MNADITTTLRTIVSEYSPDTEIGHAAWVLLDDPFLDRAALADLEPLAPLLAAVDSENERTALDFLTALMKIAINVKRAHRQCLTSSTTKSCTT